MLKKFLIATLVALFAGAAFADDAPPPKFEVTPGFKVLPNEPAKSAPPAKTKAKCPACGDDCKCAPGVCPDCEAVSFAKQDPMWFACRVVLDHGNGTGSAGSGTPIGYEEGKTIILTNAHVVPKGDRDKPIKVLVGGRTFKATYIEGSEVEKVTADKIKVLGPDLCTLSIDAKLGYVEIADDSPPIGGQVWQFGYGSSPIDGGPTAKYGLVTKGTYVEPTMVTTLDVISGDSGSGMFNQYGELCGVTWGASEDKDVYGRVYRKEHLAVEITTVRTFLKRPVLAKIFPRLAARAEARRAAREAAKYPAPSATPPVVERKGPVDPKLAAPAPAAPKPKDPPKAAAPACPDCPTAPFGSGTPPKPPGDGWQWDPARKVWWKWSTPPGFSAPTPAKPPTSIGEAWGPVGPPSGFNIVGDGGCVNGKCPNPSYVQPSFGRRR